MEGLPEGFTVEVKTEGSQTEVGSSDNVIKEYVIKDAAGNDVTESFENVQLETGTLEVTKRPVEVPIAGKKAEYEYDGTEKSVEGYTVTIEDTLYTEDDFSFNGNDEVKGTNVGEYPMGLKADQFTNNNDNFEVTFVVKV